MEEEELVDNGVFNNKGDNITHALTWWEKKRIWFNLSVGLSGLIAILLSPQLSLNLDMIAILVYGLFANLLYSIGFLLEAFDNYYFKDKLKRHRFRQPLFLIGTITFSITTFLMALVFYSFII